MSGEAQQIVGVVALGGLPIRWDVAAVVRFALVIRRRNSTLCWVGSRLVVFEQTSELGVDSK
jgi:hypothetical protein